MTASGVSSMIRSTPVACSSARIFRPSRPMMRPFISSLGMATTETEVSAVCSAATRCIAVTRMLSALLALLFDDLLARANLLGDLLAEFFFKVGEDRRPRFDSRHPRNPLELFHLLGEGIVDALPGPPDL